MRLLLALVVLAGCSGDDDGAIGDGGLPADGSDPDAGFDAAPSGVCDGLTVQDPDPEADVIYAAWEHQGCFDRPCLCSEPARPFLEEVLACGAIDGGYYWGLGSVAVRVTGRTGDDCILRVGNELEGGVTVYECVLPLPIQPWPGIASTDDHGFVRFLDGIEDFCTEEGECTVLGGRPNPCWEDEDLAAPYCTQHSEISCP
jgi:hypothetical protein